MANTKSTTAAAMELVFEWISISRWGNTRAVPQSTRQSRSMAVEIIRKIEYNILAKKHMEKLNAKRTAKTQSAANHHANSGKPGKARRTK
jgi:hypothetical protein